MNSDVKISINMDQDNRVVVLIDMDCFYCQVEEKLNPDLKGKPIAVVQYNPWKGGGIIAVNYVARDMGVTRHMRGDEAKEKCPEIELPSVPCQRGKADITKYRDAGKEVAKVLQKFTPLLERASIDEAYLDITTPVQKRLETLNVNTLTIDMMPNTFALGYDSMSQFMSDVHTCSSDSIDFDYDHAKLLLVGALIVSEIRAAVYEETGYRCSAGIAHNKILAKLVCGMNKPNKQTLLPKHSVHILYKTLSLKKVKHLGGKFGDAVCDVLKIKTMAELQCFTEKELQSKFDEKNGTWLYNIARGIDLEPVQARFNPKSIGCCKQLRGKAALLYLDSLKKWLNDLGDEIENRLEKDALENNRTPKQMVVSFSLQVDGRDTSSSRSYNFSADDDLYSATFSNKALELILESAEGCKPKDGEINRRLKAPITFLGISVGKFEDNYEAKKTKRIVDYFAAGSSKETVQNIKKTKDKHKHTEGKNNVLQKYIKTVQNEEQNTHDKEDCTEDNTDSKTVLEATLDKQESFFAKYLNGCVNPNKIHQSSEKSEELLSEVNSTASKNPYEKIEENCSNGPEYSVIACGEDSNDTNYSGSTINEEINKSIALFEDDPVDVARVSNMRELLNSNKNELENDISVANSRESPMIKPKPQHIETIACTECSKSIPVTKFEEHADYHLALKFRDEERQEIRKVRERNIVKEVVTSNKDTKKKKTVFEQQGHKNETVTSIASFLTKIDNRVQTKNCPDCGKKVIMEKFQEHQDFHEAQKLSRQINNRSTLRNVKRKRKSASPTKKPKIQCKSIDLFFR